ncbi:hypothetical protein sos41_33670 [Alphaproteobacteria bacterium SO-S41]|nr:hypothetical protein sos41_33670 [Alphaproteobacteria bacterium SO-S41]
MKLLLEREEEHHDHAARRGDREFARAGQRAEQDGGDSGGFGGEAAIRFGRGQPADIAGDHERRDPDDGGRYGPAEQRHREDARDAADQAVKRIGAQPREPVARDLLTMAPAALEPDEKADQQSDADAGDDDRRSLRRQSVRHQSPETKAPSHQRFSVFWKTAR